MKKCIFGLVAANVLSIPIAVQANLITNNPGFETGTLSGWSTGGDVAVSTCAGFVSGCAPAGGSYLATINVDGIGNAQLNQTIFLPGPGMYEFGVSYVLGTNAVGGNNDVADFTLAIQPSGPYPGVRAVPSSLGAPAFTLSDGGYLFTTWMNLSRTYTHTGGATSALVNVNLQDYGTGSNTRFIVDNIYVKQLPEPGTLALLGLALAGGLAATRRRKQ